MATVLEGIRGAECVIADITGGNPNVFYELGIAHCYNPISRVIILSQSSENIPTDLKHITCIPYRPDPQGLDALSAQLQQPIERALSEYNADRRSVWMTMRPLIESSPTGSPEVLGKIFDLVKDATRDAAPVIRLWGSLAGIERREDFMRIGRLLGNLCAERGLSISGSAVNPDNLEYYAMDAISNADVGQHRPTVYLHRAGPDLHDSRGEKLIASTSAKSTVVDIKYPAADGQRLANVDDEVGLEKTPAHDARLGSLLQCDAVFLLGGTTAPRHLIQLMAFLQERRLRAARPILFVPLPWAGGIAEKAFRVFDGVIEKIDPHSLA